MSRLLWVFGWTGVAVWSLFAFVAYGVVDVLGGAVVRNADMFSSDPETVEWLFGLFSWLHGFSTSVVLVGWGVVSLMILSVPWLFDRVLKAPTEPHVPRAPAPDGIIDLAPEEYQVRDTGGAPAGVVPRLRPRS